MVFESIVKEISILPVGAIDPVVLFYRQIAVLSDLVDDLRGESYAKLDADRRIRIFEDYLALEQETVRAGKNALAVIDRSLAERWLQ